MKDGFLSVSQAPKGVGSNAADLSRVRNNNYHWNPRKSKSPDFFFFFKFCSYLVKKKKIKIWYSGILGQTKLWALLENRKKQEKLKNAVTENLSTTCANTQRIINFFFIRCVVFSYIEKEMPYLES